MVLVAIAGGTSPTLGKSLVTAILATGKHEVIILSRNSQQQNGSTPKARYSAPISYVDYSSVGSLAAALQGVHTVISVLKSNDPKQMIEYHANLVLASIETGTVKRYAPSDFSLGPNTHKTIDVLAHKDHLLTAAQDTISKANRDIEVATFQNGMFLEYLAQGLPDPNGQIGRQGQTRREDLLSGLEDPLMSGYIDIAKGKLVVLTDKEGKPAKFTTTSIRDIGRFLAAALDLKRGEWQGYLGMSGAVVTFEEVKKVLREETLAPEIKDETTDRKECDQLAGKFGAQLASGFDLQVFMSRLVAQMVGAGCGGVVGESIIEGKLNDLCKGVEVRDWREYLIQVWGKKN